MLLKLPIERDAGQTSITITYKQQIKEYKLDSHPSVFMVCAPCQSTGWQEFDVRQSPDSRAAFLVFSLIWKNAHEMEPFLRPSELPVLLKETWEVHEALSAWRSLKSEEKGRSTPDFLCIPLFKNYYVNDYSLNTLQGIDLLHAKKLRSLSYLQVHLATVSEQKNGAREHTSRSGEITTSEVNYYPVKWISSIETWKTPPSKVWADRHLIGEPTAKMYSMKEHGSDSSRLCPVRHPVLLIRPKWTATPGKIDFSEALADLQNRLPAALKELISKRTPSDEDRYITDFKLLVSLVCNNATGEKEPIPTSELLNLLSIANKLRRFKEGRDILKLLASRKYSCNNELKRIDIIGDFIINTGKIFSFEIFS